MVLIVIMVDSGRWRQLAPLDGNVRSFCRRSLVIFVILFVLRSEDWLWLSSRIGGWHPIWVFSSFFGVPQYSFSWVYTVINLTPNAQIPGNERGERIAGRSDASSLSGSSHRQFRSSRFDRVFAIFEHLCSIRLFAFSLEKG